MSTQDQNMASQSQPVSGAVVGSQPSAEQKLIRDAWGALNFILAFYEPQNYLDTEAWKQAEAGGRRAHKALGEYLDAAKAVQS